MKYMKNINNGGGGRFLNETGRIYKKVKKKKKGTGERGRGRVLGAAEYKRVQCRFEI